MSFLVSSFMMGFPGALPPPGLHSDYAYVRNFDTGQEYYTKGADTPTIIASITKLLTAIVVLRNKRSSLSDTVTVQSGDLLPANYSQMGLQASDVISFTDLLHGLLLPSGGDAAQAAGRVVGDLLGGAGGISRFVTEMNSVAAALGMTSSAFTNTHGSTNDAGHYSTARDLAQLMDEVLREAVLASIVNKAVYSASITGTNARTMFLTTTNLILEDQGVLGGKTGTLIDTAPDPDLEVFDLANTWVAPNGQKIVIITLYADTTADRYADQRAIIGQLPVDFPALAIDIAANGSGKVLLEDNSSRVLLEDDASFLLLE